MKSLKDEIRKVICAKWTIHYPEDILLESLNTSIIKTSYLYNILPQRIGKGWEKAATFFGWKQQNHLVDLIHEQRKIAVELKTSTHSDSSAARRRKYDMLVQFKKKHPDYQVVYAVINDNTAKDKMVHDDQVRYVSWTNALNLLFGSDYNKVITVMEQVVEEYLKMTKLAKTECTSSL
jgi:hypothetical protein